MQQNLGRHLGGEPRRGERLDVLRPPSCRRVAASTEGRHEADCGYQGRGDGGEVGWSWGGGEEAAERIVSKDRRETSGNSWEKEWHVPSVSQIQLEFYKQEIKFK